METDCIQDIRIGGLIRRVASCTERLELYVDGKLDKIEELEDLLKKETINKVDVQDKLSVLVNRINYTADKYQQSHKRRAVYHSRKQHKSAPSKNDVKRDMNES